MLGVNGSRAPKDWKRQFLKALSKCPVVNAACRAARVSATHAYKEKKKNKKFSEEWDEAYELAYASLDKVHFDLAVNGQQRSVWKYRNGRPVKVETITEYTPQMMQWLLSKHYAKYKEASRVEHVGSSEGGPIQFQQLAPLCPKDLEDDV